MKKRLLLSAITGFAMFACHGTFAQNAPIPNANPNGKIRCSSMEVLDEMKKHDPSIELSMQNMDQGIQAWLANNAKDPQPNAVITIPVVFHVIWNTAAEKLTLANCQAQIAALNKDYSKTNSDIGLVPAAFTSLASNTQIQFCLAVRDPSGAATTGVIQKQTTLTEFGQDARMKYTAQGGDDAWDRSKYLNIWTVDFGSSGLLGYALFPGTGAAAEDGVVIHYASLPGAPAYPPYDLGRTATHEVGHWLGLYHTFQGGCTGTTSTNCTTGGDLICDTPPVSAPNYSCPSSTTNSCTETSPFPPPYTADQKDMWMNYMDYVDDNCMYMFSTGQTARITATMNSTAGQRSSLKTSNGCTALTAVEYLLAPGSLSVYPNPSTTGIVGLSVNIPNISNADLTVYNALGEVVLTKNVTDLDGNNEVTLDMTSNLNGMYFVKLKTSEGAITKKIILNK